MSPEGSHESHDG
jgi:serine/threonine protein kinase